MSEFCKKRVFTQSRGGAEANSRLSSPASARPAREVKGTQAAKQIPFSKEIRRHRAHARCAYLFNWRATHAIPVIHFPETVQKFAGLWKMDGRHEGGHDEFILE